MFRRLLPLVVALLTLLPAPVLAGCVLVRGDDQCCCQRRAADDDDDSLRRIDCCEQPCAAAHVGARAVVGAAGWRLLAPAGAWSFRDRPTTFGSLLEPVPHGHPRGPPARIHARIQRWQI